MRRVYAVRCFVCVALFVSGFLFGFGRGQYVARWTDAGDNGVQLLLLAEILRIGACSEAGRMADELLVSAMATHCDGKDSVSVILGVLPGYRDWHRQVRERMHRYLSQIPQGGDAAGVGNEPSVVRRLEVIRDCVAEE